MTYGDTTPHFNIENISKFTNRTGRKIPAVYTIAINSIIVYVGSTSNFVQRRIKHLGMVRNGTHYCHALRGTNLDIQVEIIDTYPEDDLLYMEQYWINLIQPIGNRRGVLDHTCHDLSKQMISKSLTGTTQSQETKDKRAKALVASAVNRKGYWGSIRRRVLFGGEIRYDARTPGRHPKCKMKSFLTITDALNFLKEMERTHE